MITRAFESGTSEERVPESISSLLEASETILGNALHQALTKLPVRQQERELAELLQQRAFVEYLKHSLALEVAQVIATYDQRTVAVHLFEESANPDAETEDYGPEVDLTVRLLVQVTARSAALDAFVDSLDKALTAVLGKLPSELFAGRTSFLNVIPVTESDIEEGRGYAVLLSSIYARPVRIWQRE
jgi:hypothetical protein